MYKLTGEQAELIFYNVFSQVLLQCVLLSDLCWYTIQTQVMISTSQKNGNLHINQVFVDKKQILNFIYSMLA